MKIFNIVVISILLILVRPAVSKEYPGLTWTNAIISHGVCSIERYYEGLNIDLIEGIEDYIIFIGINGKHIEKDKDYSLKLSFPKIYEISLEGTGILEDTIAFKDVFPTVFGNFMISKSFTIYIDGYTYGPFDLSGSSRAVKSLIDCKESLKSKDMNSNKSTIPDWLNDSFHDENSKLKCGDDDSRAIYRKKSAEYWEESCEIKEITRIDGIDAVVLDKVCSGLDGEGVERTRELLLKLDNGKIASFPPFQILKRCTSANEDDSVAIAAKPETSPMTDCQFNSRLYRSPLFKDPDPSSYQELQFTEGTADGAVDLTEYRQGKSVWIAHGRFTCSNGFSICRINFPSVLGGPVELPYETIDDTNRSSEMVAIPALRQEVYQTERNAVAQGKSYGGLVAEFPGGFRPGKDELVLPNNVYKYAGCK